MTYRIDRSEVESAFGLNSKFHYNSINKTQLFPFKTKGKIEKEVNNIDGIVGRQVRIPRPSSSSYRIVNLTIRCEPP